MSASDLSRERWLVKCLEWQILFRCAKQTLCDRILPQIYIPEGHIYLLLCLWCVSDVPAGSIFPAYRPSDTVFKITFWLGYFNSCINPIIYPCSNQEFKKAFQSLLGVHCLRTTPRPHHHHQSQMQGHGQPLTLGLDSRGPPSRLSPSSSMALSRTPSSRDSREWKVFSGAPPGDSGPAETSRAKVAKLCNKSLHRTCCCILRARTPPRESGCAHPTSTRNLPTIKIHQLSLSEKGEPV